MTISGFLTVLSSIPGTRGFVSKKIFSIKFINYAGEKSIEKRAAFRGYDMASRGRALIGSTNITGGFLCALWPLSFLAYRWLRGKWKYAALIACIISPFGALATYSRTAWLSIAAIFIIIGLFGYGGRRRIIFIVGALVLLIINQVGMESKSLYIDRIVKSTTRAITEPTASEFERFLSYSQPFEHLLDNPAWLLVGAGSAGYKMSLRGEIDEMIYERGRLATHSSFAMSYYNFGLLAAFCQILLLLFSLILIMSKIIESNRKNSKDDLLYWYTLMAVWIALIPWWLFTPNIGQMPRASMFFFFIIGLFLSAGNLTTKTTGCKTQGYQNVYS